jgi:hypothetical protein
MTFPSPYFHFSRIGRSRQQEKPLLVSSKQECIFILSIGSLEINAKRMIILKSNLKKTAIAISCCFFLNQLFAQTWFSPSSKWTYGFVQEMGRKVSPFEITIQKDTVIQGKLCSKLVSRYKDASTQQWKDIDTYGDFIVYHDTSDHAVYMFVNNRFYALYDFSKQVGDTLFIPSLEKFYSDTLEQDSGAWVRIDSIGIDTILGKTYRTLFYNEVKDENGGKYDWSFTGKVIEGIGNTVMPWPRYQTIFDMEDPGNLRCFDNETAHLKWTDLPCDTTFNYTSVEDLWANKNAINIYPNPFTHTLQIDLSKLNHPITKIILINSMGQLISEEDITDKKELISIQTEALARGLYFCRIMMNNDMLNYKLVKQ